MTVKKGSSTAKVASSADTTLWEQLLSRGGGQAPAAAAVTTGPARANSARRPAVPETAGKAAPRSDKMPKKKRKAVASADTEGVGNLHKSNWAVLAAGGGATATAAAVSNGHATTDKSKKKKAKQQGSKRPRAEVGSSNSNGMTTTTPNFFSVNRNTAVSGASSTTGVSGKAGKKRQRTAAAAAAAGIGSPTASTNCRAPNHVTGGKQEERPGTNKSTKRPRSNVLNLAFQAQKEE
ncbi:unnamed protein product, partial [Ectocarpus sp. 12 AP-2014]